MAELWTGSYDNERFMVVKKDDAYPLYGMCDEPIMFRLDSSSDFKDLDDNDTYMLMKCETGEIAAEGIWEHTIELLIENHYIEPISEQDLAMFSRDVEQENIDVLFGLYQ